MCLLALTVLLIRPAGASILFNSGDPDGLVATTSHPSTPGNIETESADDFLFTSGVSLDDASFTGLLTGGATTANITEVTVEIYRVFPKDSTVPPSGNVPTRDNSPSDVEFEGRSTTDGSLHYTTTALGNFTAGNSIVPSGIKTSPPQMTGGDGAVTGREIFFHVTFPHQIILPADHYFFVPQVAVTGGDFLWLSAAKPIVPPGTPFLPDLQTWIRSEDLDPDWLRVGTDIIGDAPHNASFSLSGQFVPEPSTWGLLFGGLGVVAWKKLRTH